MTPMACTAARRAGVRCVVCTNFTWDHIYAEYVETQGARFRVLCEEIANDYAKAECVLRLRVLNTSSSDGHGFMVRQLTVTDEHGSRPQDEHSTLPKESSQSLSLTPSVTSPRRSTGRSKKRLSKQQRELIKASY